MSDLYLSDLELDPGAGYKLLIKTLTFTHCDKLILLLILLILLF